MTRSSSPGYHAATVLLPRLITSAILAMLALFLLDAGRVLVRSAEPVSDLLMPLGLLGMWSLAIGGVLGVLAWVGAVAIGGLIARIRLRH